MMNIAVAQEGAGQRSSEFGNQLEAKLKTEFESVIDVFFKFVKQLVVNITNESETTTSAATSAASPFESAQAIPIEQVK